MLRIDLLESGLLRMSGRLAEGCREEVETFVGSHKTVPNMVVDLSEVTYIDWAGEEVLCWLGQRGVRFAANSSYPLHICERLHLRMADSSPALPPHKTQAGSCHHD
jgi:hypothetical protein